MNIFRADFDWISLLFLAIAGIIGMAKGNKNKKKAMAPEGTFYPEAMKEEEYIPLVKEECNVSEERYTTFNFNEEIPELPNMSNYYQDPKPEPESSCPLQSLQEEETDFDLRQVIVVSEILKRPQF